MRKQILLMALALALLSAGCSAKTAPESAASETAPAEAAASEPATVEAAQPAATADGHRTPPGNETAVSMGDYSSDMAVYTYYFSNIRGNLVNQALSNGYTEETLADFWGLSQNDQTINELLRDNSVEVSKEFAILYHMAEQAGTAPDTAANQADDELVAQLLAGVGGDEQAFVDRYFITPAQMKDVSYRISLVNAYRMGIFDAAEVTEEEMQAAYEANKDLYDMVTVRHVLILTENMNDEEKAEAKKRAEDVLARVEAGEDIGTLAGELSEDGGSKDKNGEYTFPRGEMVAPFEDWAFAAAVGDRGIVETTYGYHVMELMAESSYETAKPVIEQNLKTEKAQATFQDVPELLASPDWVVATELINAVKP